MNITIILEFAEEVSAEGVVIIEGKKLDLIRSHFEKNIKFVYELQNFHGKQLEFTTYSQVALADGNLLITLLIDGKIFDSINENLTETPKIHKIPLPESERLKNISKTSNESQDRPKHRKKKELDNKFKQDINNRSLETKPSDYSYFEKQTLREDLLSKKDDELKNSEVEVFYATNRKKKTTKKNRITYTNSRGDLSIGKCIVSVPGNRAKGEFPLPAWYLIGSSSDKNNYIIIKEVNELKPKDFFNDIGRKVSLSPEKDAFLFVHGFNVSFTESVSRAAQIAVDIGFHGAPIVYSWPSRKNLLWYSADEATASGYSTEDIIQLLIEIRNSGAERIHIIAHSMGNRFITDALRSLVDQGFNKDFLFNQIILAAPDIDAEVFVKQIAPKLVQSSQRVTLYASGGDIALWLSSGIHGKILRAGKITEEIANS